MESTTQQTSEGKAVVAVLAAVLERLVNFNAHLSNGAAPTAAADNVTKFHALKAPGISIQQYLERIHKYASCSTECFILALIYIDRLIQRNNFILSDLNVHRVVITAILLAAKFFDDAYYNNAYYAKVGGVLVSEMNGLEVEFLFRINFSLHVTPEMFAKYQDELVSHAIGAGLECPTLTTPRHDALQDFQAVSNALPPQSHSQPQQQQQSQQLQHSHAHNQVSETRSTPMAAESMVHSQANESTQNPERQQVQQQHHQQQQQPIQNQYVHRPQLQFQTVPSTQSQSEWMPSSDSMTNIRNSSSTVELAPKRHITPSPPHHQHPKQPIRDSEVSVFNSNSSSSSSTTSSHRDDPMHGLGNGHVHGRDHDTTMFPHLSPAAKSEPGLVFYDVSSSQPKPISARPRNNSFPTCTTPYSSAGVNVGNISVTSHPNATVATARNHTVSFDHGSGSGSINHNNNNHGQFHGHVNNMNTTTMNVHTHTNNRHLPVTVPVSHQHPDTLHPCSHSHFGHHLSPSTSPHFVTTRGV